MCGRFSQTRSGKEVADVFQLSEVPELTPQHNIAPSQTISVVTRSRQTGDRIHHSKKWGLIPSWSKEPNIGYKLFNARAETVAEKPSFRSAFQRRRCLIVTDGFYEWHKQAGDRSKQPYLFELTSRSLFAFAGLWERWKHPKTGEITYSCTILTTQANTTVAPIHHRMPVILPTDTYDEWLDPSHYNPGNLEALLQPFTVGEMSATPVSKELKKLHSA